MATFASDAFSGSAGTDIATRADGVGATWTNHPFFDGSIVVTDAGRARTGSGFSQPLYYSSGTPASAEYDVTADVVVKSHGDTRTLSIVGRLNTSNAHNYELRYTSSSTAGSRTWGLYKNTPGATLLGSYTQNLTVDQAYAAKLEIRNATKKVFVDGVERISSSDNAITAAGKAGFGFLDLSAGNTVGIHVDNVVGADPGGGGASHALSGSVLGTGSQSGILREANRVSGTSLGTGSQTGTVRATKPVAGASLGTGSQSGAVLEADSVAGSVLGTGAASGALRGSKPLTGSALGTGGATGAARASKSLSATSTGTGSQTGALAEADTVAGTSGGAGTASGVAVVAKALGGSALGTGGQTGALIEADTIAGTSQGAGGQAGALSRLVTVAGGSVGQGSVNAEAWVARRLAGSALGQGAQTGDLAIILIPPEGVLRATLVLKPVLTARPCILPNLTCRVVILPVVRARVRVREMDTGFAGSTVRVLLADLEMLDDGSVYEAVASGADVTVTLVAPDGTESDAGAVSEGDGGYYVDVNRPATAGQYGVKVEAVVDGSAVGRWDGSFRVRGWA